MDNKHSTAPVTVPLFQLVYASDPDGRDNTVKNTVITAVMIQPDVKPSADFYSSILVKYLAKGKPCEFPYYRQLLSQEHETLAAWAAEGGTICLDNEFFTLQTLKVPESVLPQNPNTLKELTLRYNQETGMYDVLTPKDDLYNAEVVELTTPEAENSPFTTPSPFIIKDGKMYATDSAAGDITGPYDKVFDALNGCYVVANGMLGGIIDRNGRTIASCKYDHISIEAGAKICIERDGLLGFFDTVNYILCEPKFTDIEFGDGEELIKVCQAGEWGYLDTELRFHTQEAFDEGLPSDIELL